MTSKKQQIRQKMIAMTVVMFMFIMISGTIDLQNVFAIGTNTTLTQNFAAGSLALAAPSSVGFNVLNVAQALNSKANLTVVNAQDYRGTGAGWGVTGFVNNMMATNAGYNTVLNSTIAWNPATAALTTPDSSNLNGNLIGGAGFFDQAGGRNLFAFNANNGMGNYQLSGTELNIVYNGRADQVAGSYVGTLTLTIS